MDPAAVGDGKTDDTAAIQKAFDGIQYGTTVYFPPGTYRITKTLEIKPEPRLLGVMIIGHGRDTRMVWDGLPDGTMILTDGLSNSRYVGMILDGKGKAARGLQHLAGNHFESEVAHRHMAFLNFTDSGIYAADDNPANSEVMFENCLFENCKRGIVFLSFNDLNFTFDGCEFLRCGTGVECIHGNTYIRNCHFEKSTDVDIRLAPEVGSSVRRCTSVGSRMFVQYAHCVGPITIQDCHVSGWTNPEGAITLNGLEKEAKDLPGAPLVMFDCVFTDSPGATPPVKILRPGQRLFLSENSSPKTGDVVVQPDHGGRIYTIPAGKRKGSITSASQRFLRDRAEVPTTVFDAKRDFGAKGDGKTDDTVAIQKTIDAARAKGKGAIAYLPTGIYVVTSTLQVTGSDYYVGGSGYLAGLYWKGPEGGTLMTVSDPQRITIENLNVGNQSIATPMSNAVDILQTDSGKPASVIYDNVTVFGIYAKQPLQKGFLLRGLGKDTTVLMRHVDGNIRLLDAANARILVGKSYEGSVTVEGKSRDRGGLQGFLTRLGTVSTHPLYVKDNQSLVMSDFYVETADNGFWFGGAAGDPPGRVTISGPKMHTPPNEQGNMAVEIQNYGGQIFLGSEAFYTEPKVVKFSHKGNNPLKAFLWAGSFYDTKPVIEKEAALKFAILGCAGFSIKLVASPIEDTVAATEAAALVDALDDLRTLGKLDLQLNHPNQP